MAGGVVLVCEDSSILRTLLADALRAHGIASEVQAVGDGMSLLSTFRLYAQAQRAVQLVLLDVELPGGPSGLTTARSLRALEDSLQIPTARRAPILFFSAHPPTADAEQAVRDCFPARYLEKTQDRPASIALEAARHLRSLIG